MPSSQKPSSQKFVSYWPAAAGPRRVVVPIGSWCLSARGPHRPDPASLLIAPLAAEKRRRSDAAVTHTAAQRVRRPRTAFAA